MSESDRPARGEDFPGELFAINQEFGDALLIVYDRCLSDELSLVQLAKVHALRTALEELTTELHRGE